MVWRGHHLRYNPHSLQRSEEKLAEASASYVPTIYFFTFLASVFGAAGLVSAGAMLADISDEHELRTGRRQEGIFFGALSFSGKA